MVPRKQAGHMTCTRPQAKRQILLAMRASSTHDLTEFEVMLAELGPLIDKVWRHCEDKGTRSRTVTLKVKFADFELISRSRTLAGAIGSQREFKAVSAELLRALFPLKKAVRLLGVSISGFSVREIERSEQIALL
ncbi:hypothetical protein [Bradyrhizobium sp.]|jgi:DNA polymerase-4|uniref:DinB/UmuC family translesion DNA polymerase n=1 Tax=Bradyrhizobium sp. TaxID=376 RepID=UPI003C1D2805